MIVTLKQCLSKVVFERRFTDRRFVLLEQVDVPLGTYPSGNCPDWGSNWGSPKRYALQKERLKAAGLLVPMWKLAGLTKQDLMKRPRIGRTTANKIAAWCERHGYPMPFELEPALLELFEAAEHEDVAAAREVILRELPFLRELVEWLYKSPSWNEAMKEWLVPSPESLFCWITRDVFRISACHDGKPKVYLPNHGSENDPFSLLELLTVDGNYYRISEQTLQRLIAIGIRTSYQLLAMTEENLLAVEGIDESAVAEIKDALAEHNMILRPKTLTDCLRLLD